MMERGGGDRNPTRIGDLIFFKAQPCTATTRRRWSDTERPTPTSEKKQQNEKKELTAYNAEIEGQATKEVL